MTTPIAVTVAGSDSGGGAGIQADLKTFSALGVYGASVVTAVTAQNTHGVTAVHEVPAAVVTAQMDAVFSDLAANAVKIGMLASVPVIEAVAAGLDRHRQSAVVLDPVMVATSGDRLLAPGAVDAMQRELLPRAVVVTPNLPEAAALLGVEVADDDTAMVRQGRLLLERGARAVLVKGGHGRGHESIDVLVTPAGTIRVQGPRIATRNTHGSGCTLSAGIAAGLAKGLDLEDALREAKAYVTGAIAAAGRLAVGTGSGPLHHFHRWW